ncbi:Armadillo-type fold containing protein [Cryptosporidium hominis]|uniref:Protein HGH1 homolog n=1 Tax=Cryptosporidium hominis TaxID=237895 RepID=A0ABX5BBS2_CRYHO|nr:Armadillo-type fold containing protein [Cryptosporidium hominis]|eukprot:PPS95032.1 Armadillo-type fold containing protein [Cryptosporidium hominis]
MEEDDKINLFGVYEELFHLLRDGKDEVIKGSMELLLDQSEMESLSEFLSNNPNYFRSILLLIGNDISSISECALKILINLSQKSEIGEELCRNWSAIEYSMDNLREQIKSNSTVPYHLSLNLMLISNLTRYSKGREKFFDKSRQSKSFYLTYLLECLSNSRDKKEREMIINILNNCTYCSQGRVFLFDSNLGIELLNKVSELMLATSRKDDLIMTKSLMSIITHVCLDKNLHTIISKKDCNVIPSLCCLVYPNESHRNLRYRKSSNILSELQNKTIFFDSKREGTNSNNISFNEFENRNPKKKCGGDDEEFTDSAAEDKVSEFIKKNAIGPVNKNISQDVFDCILVLISTINGRTFLRELGAYEVLRLWHLYESKDEIISGIEDIIHLLVYSEDELLQQDNSSIDA